MSNEILSDLLLEYDQKKRKAELDLEKRKQELYEKVPRLQEIEDSLNTFAIATAKNILNGNTTSFNELNLKVENLKKEKEKKLQQRFIECLNSFNTNAINECIKYLAELPFEVIDYVLSKTSRIQYPNWNYADTILQDYVRRKIDTVEKIQADEIGFKSQKQNTSKVVDF